jgi:DNA-binding transcriptional regulator YiaG
MIDATTVRRPKCLSCKTNISLIRRQGQSFKASISMALKQHGWESGRCFECSAKRAETLLRRKTINNYRARQLRALNAGIIIHDPQSTTGVILMDAEIMPSSEFVRLREIVGSVQEVAQKMETSENAVYRWQNGQRPVRGPAKVLISRLAKEAEFERVFESKMVKQSANRRAKAQ